MPTRIRTPGEIWAADNNAFLGWDEPEFVAMLRQIVRRVRLGEWTPPKFVTMPDVVANYRETQKRWAYWHRAMAVPEINRGYVLQDGCEDLGHWAVPWDTFEALFIGGSTEFKLGPFARHCVAMARMMGKWVHMGRVNSVRRARYARSIGCHSIDGSGLNRFARVKLIPVVRMLAME